jgi:hypothetical protein
MSFASLVLMAGLLVDDLGWQRHGGLVQRDRTGSYAPPCRKQQGDVALKCMLQAYVSIVSDI